MQGWIAQPASPAVLQAAYWGTSVITVLLDSVQKNMKKTILPQSFTLSFIHLYIQIFQSLCIRFNLPRYVVISALKSQR